MTRATANAPGRLRSQPRDLARILRDLDSRLRIHERADLAPFVNWSDNASAPIHRWLRYREAYSPNLISKLALGQRILDPFCGCGSILIGAAQCGMSATGLDLNPLAVFAATVKLTPLSRSQLNAIDAFIEHAADAVGRSLPWPQPELAIAHKVFEPLILDTLLRLRRAVESRFLGDPGSRNFLHLAWVAILEQVGSYFKEGNGIKYRNRKRLRDGYVQRKPGEWQLARFGEDQQSFVIERFQAHARMMMQDARFWRKGRWRDQEIVQGNVLEMDRLLPNRQFDSIVFSPPYANRFDYFESMKVELWFGGFVDTYEANSALRKSSLRSHLGADLNRPCQPVPELEALIGLMDQSSSSWRMRVPELLRGYFDDMRQTLSHCRGMLRSGRCFVVVGNSAFAGVIVPTDTLIAQIAMDCGFSNAEILVARHLTVAPQQRALLSRFHAHMRESVVVLS